ncbi:hypothetical protein PC128_g18074 [Phytophthora cactorum]|nr:hypothetical protein PC128_g18074 [Phytophthora cactorum]
MGSHFIGILAVLNNEKTTTSLSSDAYFSGLDCTSREFGLLAFCPLDTEEDLSGQSLFDLIADTLMRYSKPWDAIGGIPLIGCASHRFKLAVKDYRKQDEPVFAKGHTLISKLRSIKGRVLLRRVFNKAPLIRNDTHRSSTFALLGRYVDIVPALNSLGHRVLPNTLCSRRNDNERVTSLLSEMRNFEVVAKTLQRATLTIAGVRRLFDHVISTYAVMKSRLGGQARIVKYPELEFGIVKLQRHEMLSAS